MLAKYDLVLLQFILIPGYPPRFRSYLTWLPFECFSCAIIKKIMHPLPTEKVTMSHSPCSVWSRKTMTHTEIFAVYISTFIQFWFWKQIWISETILVKIMQQSLNSEENCPKRRQFWLHTLKTTQINLQLSDFNFE
jgi:hypothetical protein